MTRTINRPVIPTATSLIGTPKDIDDIANQDKALQEATDAHAIGKRIKGYLDGKGNFP
jgi:hypothetical protein